MSIKLSIEAADEITVANLVDALQSLDQEIVTLNHLGELPDYKAKDLKDCLKNRKSLLRTLRYFTSNDKFEAFNAELVKKEKRFTKKLRKEKV